MMLPYSVISSKKKTPISHQSMNMLIMGTPQTGTPNNRKPPLGSGQVVGHRGVSRIELLPENCEMDPSMPPPLVLLE